MKPVRHLTPLQMFQHRISGALEQAAKDLGEDGRQALLTYTVMRATIELASSTAGKRQEVA